MPKGVYERRGGLRAASTVPATQKESGPVSNDAPTAAPKSVKMELKRNYVPHNLISIVGYNRPAKMVKDAAGQMREVEPAAFVDGEVMPSIFPGVGFGAVQENGKKVREQKVWAGTVIEVPEDEARNMRKLGIAEAYL